MVEENMTDAFAPYYDSYFTATFDSVDDVAAYILNPENTEDVYQKLRIAIFQVAATETAAEVLWLPSAITYMVLTLPEARTLFAAPALDSVNLRMVNQILNRAVALVRGQA